MNKVTRVRKIKIPKLIEKPTNQYELLSGGYGMYANLSSLLKESDDLDWGEFEIKATHAAGGATICEFEVAEFEHCCGAREIGALSSKTLSDKDMDLIFTAFFEEIGSKTAIITTIQTQTAWEKYLTKTKLFQAVKSFVNPGTKNTITLWVSTN